MNELIKAINKASEILNSKNQSDRVKDEIQLHIRDLLKLHAEYWADVVDKEINK